MDYDFSVLRNDQIDKAKKKLDTLNKSFLKEYKMALNIINNDNVNNQYEEMMLGLEDLFRDQLVKSELSYSVTLNKVNELLTKYIK